MKKRSVLRIAAGLALVWLLLFGILGFRRWGCSLPWTQSCVVELGHQFEAAVLLLWVSDRETLISAAFAVLAAGAGVYFLYRQIKQADVHDRQRQKREHRAARALLPLALSDVCDFAEAHANEWLRLSRHARLVQAANGAEPIPALELSFPRVKDETLHTLRQIIGSAPRRKTKFFEDLLGEVQVSIARSRRAGSTANDNRRRPGDVEIMNQIVELAVVYAKATRLFDYARREGPLPTEIKPDRADVRSALRSMGWWEPNGQAIWNSFHARYPPPPEQDVEA